MLPFNTTLLHNEQEHQYGFKSEQRADTEVELSLSEGTGIGFTLWDQTSKAVSLSCSIATLKKELICGQYM